MALTTRQLNAVSDDIDKLIKKHKLYERLTASADSPVEAICYVLCEFIEWDKKAQTDPFVIHCLESSVDSLRAAAFDYYVSGIHE